MSNVLGTINPVRHIAEPPTPPAPLVVADGAQLVPHSPVDVRELGVDFLAFSAHKMMGPTGIGVLWGRAELLEAMPPFLGGGDMILDVKLDGFKAAPPPARFEAGTPPIAEAVGLTAAIDYLTTSGWTASGPTSWRLTTYAWTASTRSSAPTSRSSDRRPAPTAAACSPSPTGTCTRTTWPRCSTSSACACGRATTAPSR